MRWFLLFLLIANGAFYYWRTIEVSERVAPYPEIAAGPASLSLLSEPAAGAEREAVVVADGEPEASEQAGPVEEECWALGPFARYEQAEAALVNRARLAVETVSTESEYWVHLGPYPSLAEARAQHKAMQQKKIDSFVIRSGPLKNAVSLGLFSNPARAQLQLKRMTEKGLKAAVRELQNPRLQYWVSLIGSPADPAVDEARSQLFNKKNGSTSAEKKSCNLVASWEQFD